MSLTVVKRPILPIITTSTTITATVTDDSGDALFTKTTHGLSTGNYIYVISTLDSYNSYWYVVVTSADTFKIREYPTASNVAFVAAGSAPYLPVSAVTTTTYIAAHLPIVYKIQSDLWPINGVDTARTVSSFASYNGYTALSLSGTLHTGSTALEKVIISGTSSLDGIYTILNWISGSSIVIDLAYSASNSFSGGTVEYYYFNYHAVIRVFAGLESGHTWEDQKPMEQVAEIKCLPDATGLITVNINEYVKKQINIISNNLLLSTLPNNIDAFCQFYIETAESYDDSNGYTVEQYTSSFTSDSGNFIGRAINAKLPFKGRAISTMGDYTGTTDAVAQLLTSFSSPVLFPGNYFDVSFLIGAIISPVVINRTVYVDDVAKETFVDSITTSGIGVYRYSISQSGWSEDEIQLQITLDGAQIYATFTIQVSQQCENQSIYLSWLNYLGGFDYWNFTARKVYSIGVEESKTQEKNIYSEWPASWGEFADTIKQQTSRTSRNSVRVESQHLTQDQLDAIKWIISSPLVQIVTSQYDRRTVIVEASSVRLYQDQDKLFNIGFTISYTDELPAQSL